jgi:hypothetical protein
VLVPRDQQMQIWQVLRLWFASLGVLGFALLLSAIYDGYDMLYLGWTFFGCSGALSAGLTTPSRRARLCVWIAAVGRPEADKENALEASRLVWVDFDPIDVLQGASTKERTVGAVVDD